MKAVIQDIVTGHETPIADGTYAVYGDKDSRLRIVIRKQGDEEFIEINGDSTIEITPRASNSAYIRVSKY